MLCCGICEDFRKLIPLVGHLPTVSPVTYSELLPVSMILVAVLMRFAQLQSDFARLEAISLSISFVNATGLLTMVNFALRHRCDVDDA